MAAPGTKCFSLVDALSAFPALLLTHLVRTVTRLAVSAGGESRMTLDFRTQLCRRVMACIAIDVVSELVVEIFRYLLATVGDGRRRQGRAFRNIVALEMTFATAFHFQRRGFPRVERHDDVAFGCR